MRPDRWKQVKRLYNAALEREPEARKAFLDEACAGDEDLRREVVELLACDIPSDGRRAADRSFKQSDGEPHRGVSDRRLPTA